MARIGFIGLGNMGGPMVANLIKAGHSLSVFDIAQEHVAASVVLGADAANSQIGVLDKAEFVITMLPVRTRGRRRLFRSGWTDFCCHQRTQY
jgi:3-hydroxyisobutyrate dehydrogenase